MRKTIAVPARQGRAVPLRAGDSLVVVDVDGAQVADVWAIDAHDHGRWLSTSHTRDILERLFPRPGECFVDQRYEPILELVADTSPGPHAKGWLGISTARTTSAPPPKSSCLRCLIR